MNVKERVMTIRLLEKLKVRPVYQAQLGIIVNESKRSEMPSCRKDIKC